MKTTAKIALAFLLAASALAWWLLRTEAGRNRLAGEVARRAADATGYGVAIRGLGGAPPGSGRVAEVRLSDAKGVWLVASNVEWRATLFRGRRWSPQVHRVSAGSLDLLRVPESTNTAPGRGGRSVAWSIDDVAVDRFRSHPGVSTLMVEAEIRGSVARTASALVARARAEADGLVVTAMLNRASSDWRLQAHAAFTNAPLLTNWLGVHAEGRGELEVEFAGNRNVLRLRGRGDAGEIRTPWMDARELALTGDALRDAAGWHATAVLDLAGGARTNVAIHRLHAMAEGGVGRWLVNIQQAEAEVLGERMALAQPSIVELAPASVTWRVPEVDVRGGRLRAEGAWSDGVLDGIAALEGVSLDHGATTRLPLAGGVASAELTFGGALQDPWWMLDARATGLHVSAVQDLEIEPATLALRAVATNRRVRVQASLEGWTDVPLALKAEAPLVATGLLPRLAYDLPGRGELAGEFRLERLREITDLRGATATGTVRGEIAWDGPLAQPDVRGQVALHGGALELAESATVLRDIDLVLEGDRERLVIREATATDGAGGRLSLEGHLLFRPDLGFPLETVLTLKRAELWRPGGSRVRLDGRVSVTGSVQDIVVTGMVRAVDTEFRLARQPARVATLAVEGLDVPSRAASRRAPSRWRERVRLDLRLAGREVVVAGRGLESQWRADVQMRGTAAAPRLSGGIAVERGYFLFMGRRFALDQGGLTLDGRWPPDPELSLQASSRTADLTARLSANGPLRAPRLELTSDPPYPVDEIVSRLLFGKSADAITALQAVRLAHGLNVLRGKGSTMDVLDRGQSLLRVDQIELQQNEQSSELSSISVGKYIGRSVYVQGQKGLGAAEDVLSVEVELTPSLILQSETSPNIREGVSLQWRRDY